MKGEIIVSCFKSLFCLACLLFGSYFGQATYRLVHKEYTDVCNYTKRVISRMMLFSAIMNLFFLLIFGDDGLDTAGIVGIYISLMALCPFLCDSENGKKWAQWAIRLSVIIEIVCAAFMALYILNILIDDEDIYFINLLGLVIMIVSFIVSDLFEKGKRKEG